jgi:hypothetical protein
VLQLDHVARLCSGGMCAVCVAHPHASAVQEIVDRCRRRAAYRHVSEIYASTVVLSLSFCPILLSLACATLELATWSSKLLLI